MGSFDAFLVAGAFLVLGQQVWVVRLVQALLYMGTLATTIWLGFEAFGRWRSGLLAAAMLAIPTVNVTLYTTASLGGYGEAMLVGNLLLNFALRTGRSAAPVREFAIWAFLAGFGLWVNALTLTYSLPGFIYIAFHIFKDGRRFLPLSMLFSSWWWRCWVRLFQSSKVVI
jgi:hypothetical protein